jgi:hypothetical protein
MVWRFLRIPVIDKNSLTSSIITGFDVPPSVADHETGCQIDIVLSRRFKKHSRHRLAAVTLVLICVVANENVVEGKARGQNLMHGVNRLRDCFPRANVRLVRHHQQFVAVPFQTPAKPQERQEALPTPATWVEERACRHEQKPY